MFISKSGSKDPNRANLPEALQQKIKYCEYTATQKGLLELNCILVPKTTILTHPPMLKWCFACSCSCSTVFYREVNCGPSFQSLLFVWQNAVSHCSTTTLLCFVLLEKVCYWLYNSKVLTSRLSAGSGDSCLSSWLESWNWTLCINQKNVLSCFCVRMSSPSSSFYHRKTKYIILLPTYTVILKLSAKYCQTKQR